MIMSKKDQSKIFMGLMNPDELIKYKYFRKIGFTPIEAAEFILKERNNIDGQSKSFTV